MRATQRLYLTWDRKRVVPESNPDGRYPFCKPGDEIPEELVKKYGLQPGQPVPMEGLAATGAARPASAPASQPSKPQEPAKAEQKKAAAVAENKMAGKPQDKGVHFPPETRRQ